MICFSLFLPFPLFVVHVSNRGVRNNYNRERRENRESFSGQFFLVRSLLVLRG